MKRILTAQEERAYRLCHHDFAGSPTAVVAKIMGISQRRVQRLLQNAKRKAPRLFPILTGNQLRIKSLINDGGYTFEQVSTALNISVHTVNSTVETLKKKGVYVGRRKPTIGYENWMDEQIVEKF